MEDAMSCNDEGMDTFFSIQMSPISLKEVIEKAVATRNMKSTIIIFELNKATSKILITA